MYMYVYIVHVHANVLYDCRFFLYCIVFYYFTWAFPTDPKVFLQGAQY